MYYDDEYSANDILQYAINVLEHYGTKRHSGRYPWGSGGDPYQHEEGYPFNTPDDFLSKADELEKSGMSQTQAAKELGYTLKEYRVYKSVAKNNRKAEQIRTVKELHDEGINNSEIGRRLGLTESTVRNYLKTNEDSKRRAAENTVDFLKQKTDELGMIMLGPGDEQSLGVSASMMDAALIELKAEGYEVYPRRVAQATNLDQYTTTRILCKPGTEYKEVYDSDKINFLEDYTSHDGGETFKKMQYPASMDSSRLMINYKDTSVGGEKDGVIELRRGVKDLYLGDGVNYAQVRILVDGDRYLKGMAVYGDDLPEGIDVRFNTSKTSNKDMRDVLKETKNDPKNPFGSYISAKGQSYWTDENGEEHLSLINKRQNEGEWDSWSNTIPSQFLAKQKKELIEKQLNLTLADKKAEYEEIMSITNPTIKKALLMDFADDCDANAVDLSAAPLPRQKYNVILPLTSIGDNEVYAPNYKDGEYVALVRFPHENIGQIPILKVNNKNAEGKRVISPESVDAVGISARNAEKLSGADFDGDTVLVIPTTKGRNGITNAPTFKGLETFDDKLDYPPIYDPDDSTKIISKVMSEDIKGKYMGEVSNLIMDMTLKGASEDEIVRATKYSMTVIDAPKHKLNYQACYKEQGIAELEKKYKTTINPDGSESHGASTLLTRAKSPVNVPKRKGSPRIAEDGSIYYNTAPDSERFYVDKKTGKTIERTSSSYKMAETKDPYTLSSGTLKENLYAGFASELKSMANTARKEYLATPNLKYDKTAAIKYTDEVKSLEDKLAKSESNAPRERAANLRAETGIKNRLEAIKTANPEISEKQLKKAKKKIAQDEIETWRANFGAKRNPIEITDKEWEAIQSGALHNTTFSRILKYADTGELRKRATPKPSRELSDAQKNRIQAMAASGYTNEEIASALNISRSSVVAYKSGKNEKK